MTNYLSAMSNIMETTNLSETKFCTTCGYQNPGSVDICLNCAAALGTSCSMCAQPVPAGSKFCTQCGTPCQPSSASTNRQEEVRQNFQALIPTALAQKINAVSSQILGEQREVTVLYASLTDFATTPYGLDDEDIYFLKDEALRLLAEVIYKYEGIVDKFTGNGLVALFGAPIAHENDPERSIRAALEIQATIHTWQTRLKQESGLDVHLRLGLNTGPVIAGKVGNDLHMDYTAIGETVNLASHLELVAEPDTILVGKTTYQHTQPLFEFKTLSSVAVEWLSEPVQAFHVLGLLEQPKWTHTLPKLQTPMIGRANELARLQKALDEVRQHGQSSVVLITGQAGIGKSRLVNEFRRTLTRSNTKVYQGSCLTYARSTPLWVVAAMVRDIVGLSETAPPDAQQKTLQAYLEQMGLARAEILPYLSHVLGLDKTDPQLEARLHHLDSTMLQRQTHAALRQLFLAEARLEPTILIFEDLHWLDSASKDFLDYLIHTTADAPLLLVFVSREVERETIIRPLLTTAAKDPERLIDLQLQSLSETEGQLLSNQLITQDTTEAWFLKQHIVKRAEGNPLYIEEITRMLIDQGGLVRQPVDGTWHVTKQAKDLVNTVPGNVKGLILARFDRLPESVRQTLQKAAVVGTAFPVSLLEQLEGVDPNILTTHLTELQARQFLGTKPFRSQPGYEFCQTLTQEALYNTLLKQDRRKIHTQIAQAIEQSPLWLHEEQAEILAYHYAESTTPTRAVPYLITAAKNADRRSAYETTIKHYQQAMELLADPPNSPSDEYFRIGIGLGSAFKFVGQFASASRVLTETLQKVWVWSMAVEPEALASILVDSLHQLADIRQREGVFDEALAYLEAGLQVLGDEEVQECFHSRRLLLDRMAWIHFRQGLLAEAFLLANSAISNLTPDNTDDPCVLASLYNTLGGISWQQGNLDQATTYVEQSLQLYERIGYMWGVAVAYGNLGILYYALGNWSKAANYYEQAYAVQQIIGNPEGQATSFDNLGLLHMAMGEHEVAQQELESGLKLRQRLGDAWGTAQSHLNLAQVALVQARIDQATAYAETALSLADSIGSPEPQIESRWLLALTHTEKDELQIGLQLAEEALEMARTTGLIEKETDCLRALGILHARSGQYKQAKQVLKTAVALSKKQNDPYRQGQALLELGQVYQHIAQSKTPTNEKWSDKAQSSLSQASQHFESLGAAYDLHLARTALGQV